MQDGDLPGGQDARPRRGQRNLDAPGVLLPCCRFGGPQRFRRPQRRLLRRQHCRVLRGREDGVLDVREGPHGGDTSVGRDPLDQRDVQHRLGRLGGPCAALGRLGRRLSGPHRRGRRLVVQLDRRGSEGHWQLRRAPRRRLGLPRGLRADRRQRGAGLGGGASARGRRLRRSRGADGGRGNRNGGLADVRRACGRTAGQGLPFQWQLDLGRQVSVQVVGETCGQLVPRGCLGRDHGLFQHIAGVFELDPPASAGRVLHRPPWSNGGSVRSRGCHYQGRQSHTLGHGRQSVAGVPASER
mmetsp:Transcript_79254/g.242488  ORF Transcript_79254/g.242488 Transcript_79254/m.242488 type:complete len:298 (-) Transcript_79254:1044-1937(-)